ncbi:uncharacterized protein TNCV_1447571, partial [Trichonephila clavipes]
VEENQDNWDRFLHEFSFALRTSVKETKGKTLAELFLGRKIIPFRKLINVMESAEYVGGNIEKLFDEARQNMRKQLKTWEKYYNRKRTEVNVKVNDLVLVQTHFISAVGRRVVGKFMPKFEGPYRVLEVRNNNLMIWKKGRRYTVNIDQVQVYHPRQSDTISFGRRSNKGTAKLEDLRLKRKKRAGEEKESSMIRPGSPGQHVAKDTLQLRGRPVRSRQTITVRRCPYYLRSHLKEPEKIPQEQMIIGIDSLPQNSLRRRSLSMETFNGDQADRSEQRTKKKIRLYRFSFSFLRTSGRKNYCNEASHGRMFKI